MLIIFRTQNTEDTKVAQAFHSASGILRFYLPDLLN